jgi:hypothetical protein
VELVEKAIHPIQATENIHRGRDCIVDLPKILLMAIQCSLASTVSHWLGLLAVLDKES